MSLICISERTKALLFSGIGANMREAYQHAEERLYMDEAAEIWEFCGWVDDNVGGCSEYNVDRLFEAWKFPTPDGDAFVTDLKNRIAHIKALTSK